MQNGSSTLESAYDRGAILGRGASGVAFIVSPKNDPQCHFVAKEMCIVRSDEKRRREALAESQLLRELSHPNIIVCHDVIQDADMLYIIMEYANGGDLGRWIQMFRDDERRPTEHTVMHTFIQICAALNYIHSKKILHRDLKPANIFVVGSGTLQDTTIKLGDFGIAKAVDGTLGQANSTVGTPSYLSPEICKNKPYGIKADMWSLGVVLYELACLKVPFHAGNLPAMALMICTTAPKPLPDDYGQGLTSLVMSLLSKDPDQRPHVSAILALPYVQGYMCDEHREAIMVTQAQSQAQSQAQAMPAVQPTRERERERGTRGNSLSSRPVRGGGGGGDGEARLPSCGPSSRPKQDSKGSSAVSEDNPSSWAWHLSEQPTLERRPSEKGRAAPKDRQDRQDRQERSHRVFDRPEPLDLPRRETPEEGVEVVANDNQSERQEPRAERPKKSERGLSRQDHRVSISSCSGRTAARLARANRGEEETSSKQGTCVIPGMAISPTSVDGDTDVGDAQFWVDHQRDRAAVSTADSSSATHKVGVWPGDMHVESVSPTPEHNVFARTDEDLSFIRGYPTTDGMHVLPPMECLQDPTPPFAEPPTSSMVSALMSTTVESQARLRHRNKRRPPNGRPPLLSGCHDGLGSTMASTNGLMGNTGGSLGGASASSSSAAALPTAASGVGGGGVGGGGGGARGEAGAGGGGGGGGGYGDLQNAHGEYQQEGHSPVRHLMLARGFSTSSSVGGMTDGLTRTPLMQTSSSAVHLQLTGARSVSPTRTPTPGTGGSPSTGGAFSLSGSGYINGGSSGSSQLPGGFETSPQPILRPSGSAPSLPPLPKALAPQQKFQRSRSVVGIHPESKESTQKMPDRDAAVRGGAGYGENFQPHQRHPLTPHGLFRTAPVSTGPGGPEGQSSSAPSPLPPSLSPPTPQLLPQPGPVSTAASRHGQRDRDEAATSTRFVAKLPVALTAQGDGRHFRDNQQQGTREGWCDMDGRMFLGTRAGNAELEGRTASARLSVV